MKDANSSASGSKSAGTPMPEIPQAARESFEKMTAATADASMLIQNACSSAVECNTKVIEFARANTNAAFDYANDLLGVKSPADLLKVVTEHARKQYVALSAQTKELTALGQKAMQEATEPFKAGAEKALRGPLA
jgi:phasin